jgi:hypothetical protein
MLKAGKRKINSSCIRNHHMIKGNLPFETTEVEREWDVIFKILREKRKT